MWIGCSMSSRLQYTDLTTMGGTGPCGPIKIIFGYHIYRKYTSLNIKFGANRTFHVPKIPVYRFGLYGSYQILWNNIAPCVRTKSWLLRTCGLMDGRTNRQSSNVLEFRPDQMSPGNLGSQINISRCLTRTDKTNISSMRRV